MSSPLSFPLDRPPYYQKDDRLEEAELAYIDSCQRKVAEWVDAGLFTPELILERLLEESQPRVSQLFEGLRPIFAQATTNSQEGLNEAIFTRLLTEAVALPAPILQGVGPILFNVLAYASSIPFPSPTHTTHLSLDALIRALAILTPGLNPLSKGDESSNYVVSCRRTPQDARRIIFQGLASPGSHIEEKPSVPETGGTIDRDSVNYFIDVSSEDARTTDLLDALVVSQPEQKPWMSKVARCFFKDVAATLLTAQIPQEGQPLYSLRVSKEKFRAVLRLALALQALESDDAAVVVTDVESSAERLLGQVFEASAESVGLTRFEEGVEKTMPDLLDRLGGIFGAVFGVGVDEF